MVSLLNDAVVRYNKKIQSSFSINMTLVDSSKNPEKVRHYIGVNKYKGKPSYNQPSLKIGDYVRMADQREISSIGYKSNWNEEWFENNRVKKHNREKKKEDINGEIIEGKYYKQELLKTDFDFESHNDVLESPN